MKISQLNGNTLVDATFHEYINTVGAVIFSFDNGFSPSALWGGSWSRITNRFLIGSGGTYTTGATGGEANVTLTVDQMPNHVHDLRIGWGSGGGVSWGKLTDNNGNSPSWSMGGTGGNQPHNNMPPYIGCNIWRKIA